MKITPASFLLAVLIGTASACPGLELQTQCIDDDGKPCRQIPQLKNGKCGVEKVFITASWCNRTGKPIATTSESTLKLTGGAATSLNGGNPFIVPVHPIGRLNPGECKDAGWLIDINNCRQFFNYEVDIKTTDPRCRFFFFTRQMKTRCSVFGKVGCTLPDGTECTDFKGPKTKVIKEPGCPVITCIDQTPESCRQDVKFDFTLRNREDQLAKFDLSQPKIANSQVAWKIVPVNTENFSPLEGNSERTWDLTKVGVNTCRKIPGGSINIRGNIIDSDTGKNDVDYRFCFNFNSKKKQVFDEETGKLPFCQDIGPFGPPPLVAGAEGTKGEGKGPDTPPTPCPGIHPESAFARGPRDKL